jgi:nitric oxide reductase NorD protein
MEEFVGGLWHRLITRAAQRTYPEAAARLADIEKTAGVLFRAFGGDAGLRVATAAATRHGGRRRLLQRIAGSGLRADHATRDDQTLQLPGEIALFPDPALNRDLYLWLVALAACDRASDESWIVRNQRAARTVLEKLPGMAPRYRALVNAVLAQRIAPEKLPADEAEGERAIRRALEAPGSVAAMPLAHTRKVRPPQPVALWLYPTSQALDVAQRRAAEEAMDEQQAGGPRTDDATRKRLRGKRVDAPDGKGGFLLMFRAESLLSWAEYIKVDRPLDDDPDAHAAQRAEELDELAVARDGRTTASKVRFDLDLPSAAQDDLPLGEGILLPEWDYRKRILRPDYCRVQPLVARDAAPCAVPVHLRKAAQKLRWQFSALQPVRRWLKSQPDGSELDLDACVRAHADRLAGSHGREAGTYLAQLPCERDLACLVLADLSLSTDAWVTDHARVIDVVKDSLVLFAEALAATGDAFALYGFSSLKRSNVRLHQIKTFAERHDGITRGRIAALKPGYYTRLGAAIRHATQLLEKQPAQVRLLLILTDGKPNDTDHYEGRYGIEDTRVSVVEARDRGLRPFCVTIDREGEAYLPHLFGPAGFTVIRRPEELPARLPRLYAQLTQR